MENKSQITSVSFYEADQEGGHYLLEIFPSGYVRMDGKASGLGFRPPLDNGIYVIKDVKKLQTFFDTAKAIYKNQSIKNQPTGMEDYHGSWGHIKITTTEGSKQIKSSLELSFSMFDIEPTTKTIQKKAIVNVSME